MFPEESQQGKRFLTDTLDGILYKFRRDEAQTVLYTVIMSGNLACQVIYGAVHGNGILTPPIGTTFFRIPDSGIDRDFGPYLCPFGINAHLAQQLAHPVLAHFRAIDIKQYGKSAAPFGVLFFCILFHILAFKGLLLNDDRETFRNFPVQRLCVGVYLVVGHFCVNLRGFYLTVSEHFADRFKRHSV